MDLTPQITHQICQLAGIRVVSSTPSQLAEWLTVRCHALGLKDAPAYALWLADPLHLQEDREALCNLLTSRETYFLRDRGVIDVLREYILKETIERRSEERRLKIWSAACSTGEEAYTLSILLEEVLPDWNLWQLDILGSDIDQDALNQARRAVYRKWSFRGCSPQFTERYFHTRGEDLCLLDRIQKRVRFEALDLVGGHYPSAHQGMLEADIILCRNVFIYLDHAAIATALEKLVACLSEGGFLLCAPGELHAHAHPQLKARIYPQALVYQKVTPSQQPQSLSQRPALAAELALPVSVWTPKPPASMGAFAGAESETRSVNLAQAWTQANRGDLVAASALCEALMRQDPLSPHVRYLDAVLQLAKGYPEKARDALRQVLYLDPLFAVAYVMLHDVYRTDHQVSSALKTCQQGLKALATQTGDQPLAYFKSVTVDGLRQFFQAQIESLTFERDLNER